MKKTKIVATISDLRCDIDFIRSLHEAGVDVVRLNTAHMAEEGALRIIQNVRAVSDRIAILIDTKGPEVRTGKREPVPVRKGQVLRLGPGGDIELSYERFVQEVPPGASILIDDGLVRLTAAAAEGDWLSCIVENDGIIGSRKSVNVPNVRLNVGGLSEKDLAFIRFSIEHKVDFIAHSFVRNAADVLAVQQLLDKHGSPIRIIAKIENREGVERIGEILDHAYGVMVARGDLAVEIPAEEVPLVQKRIIRECIARAKPVITATQMLHTMIDNPRPTRAEVSDVANAVLDGTDAIMLSGETASGKYPLEAVQTMARVAAAAETERVTLAGLPVFVTRNKTSSYLAKCAVLASQELPTNAIVVGTNSGHTARIVAAYRGRNAVHAICYEPRVARQLALSYGVIPGLMPEPKTVDAFVTGALQALLASGVLQPSATVALLASAPGTDRGATMLEINAAGQILEEYG